MSSIKAQTYGKPENVETMTKLRELENNYLDLKGMFD